MLCDKNLPRSLNKKSLFFRSFPKPFLLILLKKKLLKYSVKFESVLTNHFCLEFEINIRDGTITQDGQKILASLAENHEVLQFEARVREIFLGLSK